MSLHTSEKSGKWTLTLLLVLAIGIAGGFIAYQYKLNSDNENLEKALSGHRKNAPYIVSPQDVVDLMLKLGEVDKDDVVFDLGCGDGRIVIEAAKQFGCQGVGYEYDPEIADLARQRVKEAGVEHLVTIHQGDIFKIPADDLNKASVITLYLLDWMNKKLIPQLRELDDGKLVVSHDWGLDNIPPDNMEKIKSVDDPDKNEHVIRVWKTPLGENKPPQSSNENQGDR